MRKVILISCPIIITIFVVLFFVFNLPTTNDDGVKYLLGVSFSNLSESEQASIYNAIVNVSRQDSDTSIVVTNASGSIYTQLKDLKKLQKMGVDAMIVCADGGQGIIKNEIASYYGQIPIAVFEKNVSGYNYDIYVGVDDYEMGYNAGLVIGQKLGDEKCTVVEIKDAISIKTTQERSKGFYDALESYKNIQTFSVFFDPYDSELQDKLKSLYKNNDDIKALFLHNIDVAIEASLVAEKMDMDDVYFSSISNRGFNDKYSIDRMKKIDSIFSYNYYGEHLKNLLKMLIDENETIVKKNILNVTMLNSEDLAWYVENGRIYSGKKYEVNNDTIIGYIGNGLDTEYYLSIQNDLKSFFKKEKIRFIIHPLTDSVKLENMEAAQEKAFDELIEQGAKIIFYTPYKKIENTDLLKNAKLNGVRVIMLDERIPYTIQYPITFIGSDGYDEGYLAAEWIVDRVYSDKEDIVIAEITSNMDLLSTQRRREGFRNVINGYLRISIAQSVYGYDSYDGGAQAMNKILDNHDDINLLYVHNQEMAIGAIDVLKDRGYNQGVDVKIIVNQGMAMSEKLLRSNSINCIIKQKGTPAEYIECYFNDIYLGFVMNQKIILADEVIENGE